MAQLTRLIYLDVIVRTSWFPALVGLAAALWTNVGIVDWRTWLSLVASLIGVLVIQGMYQHSLDVLHDKGGYSAFRQGIDEFLAKKLARVSLLIAAILAVIIVICQRWWLLVLGVAAVRSAKLYVESHNEFYAVFGFMLSYSIGYFSSTNYPTLVWLVGLLLIGLVYRAALPMYRLDDYLAGELPSQEAIIQYFRNIMRYALHMIPLLTILFAFSVNLEYPVETVMPWAVIPWIIGFGIMGFSIMRYKAKAVMQEAPVWAIALAIMLTDIASAYFIENYMLFLKMIVAYAIWWVIFMQFWLSRHALCNYIACPINPLTIMRKEKPK